MKTLGFLSVVLGLVVGPVPMELAVPDGTAEVEIRVDGELRARLDTPPWRATVDLGEELAPRRVEAVARDASGREIDQADLWLNVPRGPAEVQLTVAGGSARLTWSRVDSATPRQVRVTFDGSPLPVDDPGAIPLPHLEDDHIHVLSAEVIFPDGTSSRTDLALGGSFGEAVDSELTAVAVQLGSASGDASSGLDAVSAGSWVNSEGRPLPVRAVEAGAAEVYFVLDRGAAAHLAALGRTFALRLRAGVPPPVDPGRPELYSVLAPTSDPSLLRATGTGLEDRLVLVRPTTRPGAAHHDLFPRVEVAALEDSGSAWRLAHLRFPNDSGRPQRLADAVAAAGLGAAASGHRRAVVLVLGPGAEDASRFSPAEVRDYLALLGVPLTVWKVQVGKVEAEVPRNQAPVPSTAAAPRARNAAPAEAWEPAARSVRDLGDWLAAHRELDRALRRQRILWVEGRPAPGSLSLAPAAPPDLSLVGSGGG